MMHSGRGACSRNFSNPNRSSKNDSIRFLAQKLKEDGPKILKMNQCKKRATKNEHHNQRRAALDETELMRELAARLDELPPEQHHRIVFWLAHRAEEITRPKPA